MAKLLRFVPTVLKNLFSPPVTTSYPAEPAVYPERSRGHITIDIDDCISCGMCVRCCPPGCLAVSKQDYTWTINRFDCIACGNCVERCPKKCLHMVPGYQEPMGAKSEEVFKKSEEAIQAEIEKKRIQAEKAAAAKAAMEAKKKAEAEAKAKAEAEFSVSDRKIHHMLCC